MKENIPGCPGYHVTRNGKVYSNKLGAWVRKSSFYLPDIKDIDRSRNSLL